MGTSTMGSDLHSDKQDKLLKLQARKKELEQMLASKNEELYKLCVQEVQLTGVVPPEAPLSPDVPRGAEEQDGADVCSRRPRPRLSHRLSTPGAHPRLLRRPDTSCSNFFPSPPQERHPDTFSIHASHTFPAAPYYSHPAAPLGPQPHFSSSHPDMAAPPPLLYQYAAQLRAQSQHLQSHGKRRSTLQRTQTYHLTAHSDYNHHQHQVPNTLPLRERTPRLPLYLPLQVTTDDVCDERSHYSPSNCDSVSMNKFSPLSPLDGRAKEKQWYETSLDSPTRKGASLKRTPSTGHSQQYEVMISSGRHSALQSSPVISPGAVSLEAQSPSNMTVIQQGKCIPYREETKPFEMSDFYKYSTKFRQTSTSRPAAPPPGSAHGPAHVPSGVYNKMPAELPQFVPDQWHRHAN